MMVTIVLNAGFASPGSGLSAGALAGRYTVDVLFCLLPVFLLWSATFSRAARDWYARS